MSSIPPTATCQRSGYGSEDDKPELSPEMEWVPRTIFEIHPHGWYGTRQVQVAVFKSGPYGSRANGRFLRGNRSAATKAASASRSIRPNPRQAKEHLPALINDARLPNAQLLAPDSGVLGPWENSITNNISSHECFSHLSDFLYKEVVARLDVEGPLEAGTAIKVEAKIGQLVSQDTNTRIRLPIMGEQAIKREDGGVRTAFKTSITQVNPSLPSPT